MLKSLEVSDPESCLNVALEDEPIFVLLGRDASAPAAITAWFADRLNRCKNRAGDPQMIEAREAISAMLDWRAARVLAKPKEGKNE